MTAAPDVPRATGLLAPEETGRVRLAHGPSGDRLRRTERRYDPPGLFSAVPTLPPAGPPVPRVER
ncbi:hypothetical protein [Micromonospora schwarzwaldensis]|uniref:hypothetical protein n=1 Tax=Micromonospora sp. DSM 45708 TaxID=3111767 RepID=UPI0031D1D27F